MLPKRVHLAHWITCVPCGRKIGAPKVGLQFSKGKEGFSYQKRGEGCWVGRKNRCPPIYYTIACQALSHPVANGKPSPMKKKWQLEILWVVREKNSRSFLTFSSISKVTTNYYFLFASKYFAYPSTLSLSYLLQIYPPEIGCEHLKIEPCLLSLYFRCLVQFLEHRSHLMLERNWILSYVLLKLGK